MGWCFHLVFHHSLLEWWYNLVWIDILAKEKFANLSKKFLFFFLFSFVSYLNFIYFNFLLFCIFFLQGAKHNVKQGDE